MGISAEIALPWQPDFDFRSYFADRLFSVPVLSEGQSGVEVAELKDPSITAIRRMSIALLLVRMSPVKHFEVFVEPASNYESIGLDPNRHYPVGVRLRNVLEAGNFRGFDWFLSAMLYEDQACRLHLKFCRSVTSLLLESVANEEASWIDLFSRYDLTYVSGRTIEYRQDGISGHREVPVRIYSIDTLHDLWHREWVRQYCLRWGLTHNQEMRLMLHLRSHYDSGMAADIDEIASGVLAS